MKSAIVIFLALLPVPLMASEVVDTVPELFQGQWGGTYTAECGTASDELALRIEAGRITVRDRTGPLKAIVVDGHDLALVAELSNEGHTWLSVMKFVVSAHGGILVDITSSPRDKVRRFRCSE